jgi:hypothetical protein
MRVPTVSAAERLPQRSRLPPPPGRLRRAELTAALGVAVVVLHLLFAPVTLFLGAGAVITSRATRWRPLWLTGPAGAGLIWVAAIGVNRAATGFAAGPARVGAYLAGSASHPARLLHLSAAFAGAGHWLPEQFPVALIAAAAEAAALCWLTSQSSPEYRPGLLVAIRRRRTVAALTAGEVVTRDGFGLGVDGDSGRLATISWADAEGGLLVAGAGAATAALAAVPVAWAAVRRRKTVIVIDLTGSPRLDRAVTAACETAGAPLARFGAAGPGCYEPFRSHPPPGAAGLAAAMIDWTGLADQQRQAGQRSLGDAFRVLAAGPGGPGGPATSVLDGLIDLLEPAAPRRALATDPAAAAALRGQLQRLRASAPGRWLRAPEPDRPLDADRPPDDRAVAIGQAVRDRGVVLFSLGRGVHEEAAAMIARLAVADLTAVLSGLRDQHLRADCLTWIHGCEAMGRPGLAALLALGPATGTSVLLSTANAAAAASLAPAVRVVVTGGPADQGLATRLGETAEFRKEGGQQAVAELLRWQDEDEFAIIGPGPGPRLRPGGRLVPGPWAGPR